MAFLTLALFEPFSRARVCDRLRPAATARLHKCSMRRPVVRSISRAPSWSPRRVRFFSPATQRAAGASAHAQHLDRSPLAAVERVVDE
jgi:hypothetical protein